MEGTIIDLFKNLILMKRLLRQGWVRIGVPKTEIESLADHSFSTAVLSIILALEENGLRRNTNRLLLDPYRVVILALFHDLSESEYLDIDKSVYNLGIDQNSIKKFLDQFENGANEKFLEKLPDFSKNEISKIRMNATEEELMFVKLMDKLELYMQTQAYHEKKWLTQSEKEEFQNKSIEILKEKRENFLFIDKLFSNLYD